MLSRRDPERRGKAIPTEWTSQVRNLLSQIYLDQCGRDAKEFSIYGELFEDEITLCVSLISITDINGKLPISLVISSDLDDKKNAQKLLDQLVDCMGIFFDEVFSQSDWSNYEAEWKQGVHKNNEFYYRSSRENIKLSLEADKLLSELDN